MLELRDLGLQDCDLGTRLRAEACELVESRLELRELSVKPRYLLAIKVGVLVDLSLKSRYTRV